MKKVSIIILTYNCLEEATKPCLESIYSCKTSLDFDVVVVDNFSIDGTREYLTEFGRTHKNYNVILNEENYGYAKGINIGIRSVDADYYVLLNNDTIVTGHWLDKMIGFLEEHAEVGIVGPVSNSVGNEQVIYVESKDQTGIIREGLKWAQLSSGDYYYTEMIGFFCAAIRKELILEVGLIDEGYRLGMVEDDDFCYRTLSKGYKLACLEDVFIYHKGSISFNKIDYEQKLNSLLDNISHFESKFTIKYKSRWSNNPFINLLNVYLNSCNSTILGKIKLKTINKLNVMRSFDYTDLHNENLNLHNENLNLHNENLNLHNMIRALQSEVQSKTDEIEKIKTSDEWIIGTHIGSVTKRLKLSRFLRRTLQNCSKLKQSIINQFRHIIAK